MKQALTIGEVSALFDLTPAALRWWEKQGVLPSFPGDSHRRMYEEHDVLRVGLAYLCCVVGKTPLSAASVITSGRSTNAEWREVVADQIDRINQQISELEKARTYLTRLRLCTDDDPVTQCPFLPGDIEQFTPLGRMSKVAGTSPEKGDLSSLEPTIGDESQSSGSTAICPECGSPIEQRYRGRPRGYCSARCRQRAYRSRQKGRTHRHDL